MTTNTPPNDNDADKVEDPEMGLTTENQAGENGGEDAPTTTNDPTADSKDKDLTAEEKELLDDEMLAKYTAVMEHEAANGGVVVDPANANEVEAPAAPPQGDGQPQPNDNAGAGPEIPNEWAPMPMPGLARGQRVNQRETQPGAYSGGVVGGDRRQEIDRAHIGNQGGEDGAAPVAQANGGGGGAGGGPPSDDGLVAARPVGQEPVPEMSAVPFDSSAMEREKEKDQKMMYLIGAFVLAGVALIILILTVFKSDGAQESTVDLVPTVSPAEITTAAPTTALDLFRMELPESSQEQLNDISTPQWKAFDWLSNHPQLSTMQDWRKSQLFALVSFYYAMEGPNWPEAIKDNWLTYESEHTDQSECFWFSFSFGGFAASGQWLQLVEPDLTNTQSPPCSSESEFWAIVLRQLELEGYKPFIPPEALMLPLKIVEITESKINASLTEFLPEGFFSAYSNSLEYFALRANELSGKLPSELGLLTKLQRIQMYYNDFSGTIPTEWAGLQSLDRIGFLQNRISGTFPTEIHKMWPKLAYLDLGRNLLSGSLPSELGILTRIHSIYLYDNQLTGTLPTELGLMDLYQLQIFNNSFVGTFPTELTTTRANRVRIHLNSLTGSLPAEIGVWSSLNWLQLGNNLMSGSLPDGLTDLHLLQHLYLHDNHFTGPLPQNIGNMTTMQMLHLNSNKFTGMLPAEFGELGGLERLLLHDNLFSGSVPTEYGNLTGLTFLTLGSNPITGTVPSELALLTSLVELDLSDSLLTGAFPLEIGDLVNTSDFEASSLKFLNISGTGITGTIPDSLCALNHNSSCTYPRTFVQNLLWDAIKTNGCALVFDCSATLCGCDCACPDN